MYGVCRDKVEIYANYLYTAKRGLRTHEPSMDVIHIPNDTIPKVAKAWPSSKMMFCC